MPTLARQGTRILRDTSADIELTVYIGGVATAPDSAPTVSVVNAAGTVIASGTGSAATPSVFTLSPTATADVNQLTATWTGSWGGVPNQVFLTYHQVVGSLLFNLAEARAFDEGALASTTTYPTATIIDARDRIAEAFEDVCTVPFGLSYGRETLDGTGDTELWLSARRVSTIRSISTRASGGTTLTAFTAGELADVYFDAYGRLSRETLGYFTSGRRNVVVEYEYGYQPVPLEIKRAALILLRDQLVSKNYSSRNTSVSDETGTFALATAGLRGSYFGLPLVDEVLGRYRDAVPGVA